MDGPFVFLFRLQTEDTVRILACDEIKKGLSKTANVISNVFHGFTEIDDDFYDELEEILVMGDVGVNTAMEIVEKLRDAVFKKNLRRAKDVKKERQLRLGFIDPVHEGKAISYADAPNDKKYYIVATKKQDDRKGGWIIQKGIIFCYSTEKKT